MATEVSDQNAVQASRLEILEQTIAEFAKKPAWTRSVLKRWSEMDQAELGSLGVQILGRSIEGPGERCLIRVLLLNGNYYTHLLDSSSLRAEDALPVAAAFAAEDPEFFNGLIRAADENPTSERLSRALHILGGLQRSNVTVPWLRRLLDHPDRFVRSKAVSLLCKLYANPRLIEKQLESLDERVRANAVEALWGLDDETSCNILLKAADDPHHRVAVNAIYGLYLAKDPRGAERLISGARHESPHFRAAHAWAMGQTEDQQFALALRSLLRDDAEGVRSAAARAVEKLGQVVSVAS